MPIPDHVVRFWRAVDDLVGRVEPTWWGAVVTEPRFPEIWDANYARVDRPTDEVTVEDIEAALLPALAAAGARTFHLVSFFPEQHRGLLAALSSRGHRLGWDLVMDLAGPDTRRSDAVVEELAFDATFRGRLAASFPLFGVDGGRAAEQLLRLEDRLTTGGKRWFGVRDEEGVIVSLGALLVLEGVAYVDNVATFSQARGQGYASQIAAHITDVARGAGAEHVILLADPDARPVVRMYERLGFRDAGRLGSIRGPMPTS